MTANGPAGSLNRVDPEIKFQFGTSSPIPEQDAIKEVAKRWQQAPLLFVPLRAFRPFSQEFRITWQGSLLAPETGEYEFLVRTENATKLSVNDLRRPLIDALVKSGSDTEYRGSVFLLGGRPYPIRLEFSRSKEVTSSIALEWKVPRRAFEVIPRRNLSPVSLPETFVLTTPFPPDDRSAGYERGTSISKAWDLATTDAAIEVASYIVGHLKELSGVADDASDREAKLREFCSKLAERAFRRPLTAEEKAIFIDRQFKDVSDPETAVKRVGLLVLKSPRFLYRETAHGRPDSYDVASRLSFGLWDSLPDEVLLKAAASGELVTRAQVAGQAERMVKDPRALTKLEGFFHQWLKIDQAREIAKDPKRYPEFDEKVVSDLRTSLDLLLDDVLKLRGSRLSPALPRKTRLLEWPAGGAVRSQAPRRRAVPKGFARARRAPRVADPPLLAGEFRLYSDELADPSRSFHRPQRPGPGASSPSGGRRSTGSRYSSGHDDPTARFDTNPARILPVVSRDDQSLGIYPGAFRRRGSISKRGERQAHRRHRIVRDTLRGISEIQRSS